MKRVARLMFALGVAACVTLGLVAGPALANSARTQWEGVSATGAIVAGSDVEGGACPIVVERELLTFDIQEFPREYPDPSGSDTYDASVTAEYTFSNPADYAVSATLLFPFGKLPDYGPYPIEDNMAAAEAQRYGISVDGNPAESVVRHTLSYPYDAFDLEEDLALLLDGYVEDPFFTSNLPVTRFSYEISGLPEDARTATIGFRWTPSDGAKVLLVNQSGYQQLDDGEGSVMLRTWAENGLTVDVYVFGKAPEGILAGLFENSSCEAGVDGRITNVGNTTMTFEEFALQAWDEGGDVLAHDWYNAMVADLRFCEQGGDGVIMCDFVHGSGFDLTHMLMQWYEYELSFEPGQTLVNAVTAPLYPAINASYDPPIYGYSYLLSPASTWAEFGRLDVVVNTPFFMTGSQLDGVKGDVELGYPGENAAGFEKVEGGYALSSEGLPDGELAFSLSAEEDPAKARNDYAISMGLMFGGMILAFVVVLGLIGLAIGFVVGRLLKRRRR